MSLGSNIRNKRKSLELSQEYVAEQLLVSRQAVSKWETGQSEPSTNNLINLAELFSCDVKEILSPGKYLKENISSEKQGEQSYKPITLRSYHFSYTHLFLTLILFSASFTSHENALFVTLSFLLIVNITCFSSEYFVLKYYQMNQHKKANKGYALFIMIQILITIILFVVFKAAILT